MNIVVLEGSPNKNGSSNLLANEFIRGAQEAGHSCTVIDAAHANIHPCTGCVRCGYEGPCVQKDDMERFRREILDADMMVFVTPLYYFTLSAQLKLVIDRFYSFNDELAAKRLKTALIAAAWDNDDWTMRDLKSHYETMCRYLNFQDQGQILGTGCGTVPLTERSRFPQMAYELGKSL